MTEFNKLQQEGNVSDYQDCFEKLRASTVIKNRYLTEEYFVSSFFSGLQEEIRSETQLFQPKFLTDTINLVTKRYLPLINFNERTTVKVNMERSTIPSRNSSSTAYKNYILGPSLRFNTFGANPQSKSNQTIEVKNSQRLTLLVKSITMAEMEAKRRQRLGY